MLRYVLSLPSPHYFYLYTTSSVDDFCARGHAWVECGVRETLLHVGPISHRSHPPNSEPRLRHSCANHGAAVIAVRVCE